MKRSSHRLRIATLLLLIAALTTSLPAGVALAAEAAPSADSTHRNLPAFSELIDALWALLPTFETMPEATTDEPDPEPERGAYIDPYG